MSFDGEERIAEMDRELSRPWLKDLRTKSLMESASHAVRQYGTIRAVDKSGVVGELLDLLEAVTARLSAVTDALDREKRWHEAAVVVLERIMVGQMPALKVIEVAARDRAHVLGEEQN